MCMELGANFDLEDNQPHLKMPNGEEMFIFYDSAHVEISKKCLGKKKAL